MSVTRDNVARNALNKEFKKFLQGKDSSFEDEIAFYVDNATDEYYEWKFTTPDGKTHYWRYSFSDKSITKETV